MLSNERTHELLAAAKQGSDAAKAELIIKNSPLIKSICKRYLGKGVEYDDLFQLGCMGFVKAINKYDAAYGVKFTTYAVPLIMGEIKRFLRDDGIIKVSRSVKGLFVRIKRLLAERHAEQEQPGVEEIARQLEVSAEDVIFAMEASHMPLALFEKGENNDGDKGVSIAEKLASPERIDVIDRIMLRNMIAGLTSRERKVIVLRYFRNATQTQVAERLGISQVQVSRIEQRVLERFRNDMLEKTI